MLFSGKYSIDTRLKIAIGFILASFLLVFLGLDRAVSIYLLGLGPLGALIAGAFYTLGATTPFAMVVVLELMKLGDPLQVAFFACLSAAAVDTALFMAVKDALEKNSAALMKKLHKRFDAYSYAFPAAGFFVFGMPLPDELGLALMEMTRINPLKLAAVVFAAKFLTLLLLFGAIAR